jgi:hypothetical protein
MSRARRAGIASVAVAALVLTGTVGGVAGAQGAQSGTGKGDRAETERLAMAAGLQVGPKHQTRPTVRIGGAPYLAANPYLAQLRDDKGVDWSYWRRRLAAEGDRAPSSPKARTAQLAPKVAVPTPYTYDEQEPAGDRGANDTQDSSERLNGFGIGRARQAVEVDGALSLPAVATTALRTREDQGSIPKATATGIPSRRHGVTVSSRIGDGPHGRARDGHGDFDFFKVHAVAGQAIRANTIGSRVDTVLVVYKANGSILDANDDLGESSVASSLTYRVPAEGDYYVMVGGYSDFGPVPENPFRSGSGSGAGEQGTYKLSVKVSPVDDDYYGVHLDSGDVLGGTLKGAARTVQVHRVDGQPMIASEQDASSAYPSQSPLPGGGATFAYVAEEPGWYAVSAAHGNGAYTMLLEAYRPGSEKTAHGAVQKIFLDFDGERMNTNIFGGNGVSTLAPLSRFLPRWGLTDADENAVIDATIASFKEDVETTLREQGLNDQLRVQVLNSRDDADPFGEPNVSRVVVGGSIRQTGVPTIGIAQSIDPGNYAHEESAMVLLDSVAEPSGAPYSFNTYLGRGSDKTGFIGRTLGELAAHETGHMIGSFHTNELNTRTNLMDSGGENQARFFGVGPDQLGGTADDRAVNFGEDRFTPFEGFTGFEDTLNNSAWAFSPGR